MTSVPELDIQITVRLGSEQQMGIFRLLQLELPDENIDLDVHDASAVALYVSDLMLDSGILDPGE